MDQFSEPKRTTTTGTTTSTITTCEQVDLELDGGEIVYKDPITPPDTVNPSTDDPTTLEETTVDTTTVKYVKIDNTEEVSSSLLNCFKTNVKLNIKRNLVYINLTLKLISFSQQYRRNS